LGKCHLEWHLKVTAQIENTEKSEVNMKKRYAYIIVAILSLMMLAYSSAERFSVERSANKVDMILDYSETKALADQSGDSFESWLKSFKGMGFGALAIEEESLKSLKDSGRAPLDYTVMKQLKDDYEKLDRLPKALKQMIYDGKTDDFDVVVETPSREMYEFIQKGVSSRYDGLGKSFEKGGVYYVLLDGTSSDAILVSQTPIIENGEETQRSAEALMSKLEGIGLGFDKEKIDEAKSSGLKPLLRPINFERMSSKLIDAYFADVDMYGAKPDYMVFMGKSAVGYDGADFADKAKLLKCMADRGISVGMIETGVQRQYVEQGGIKELAQGSAYNVVRVFPIVKYIQMRYAYLGYEGAEEIENTIYRAVTERNIRSVYFRPFMSDDITYVTDRAEYEKTFKTLQSRLAAHNISYGKASVFKEINKGAASLTALAGGLIVALLVMLGFIVRIPAVVSYILLGGGLAASFALSIVAPSLAQTVFSFGSAVVFPCLSVGIMLEYVRGTAISDNLKKTKTIIKDSVLISLLTIGIVTLGGLYIGSFLGSSEYIIEMDIFHGVKLSQAIPPLAFLLFYFIRFGFMRSREELRQNEFFYLDIKRLMGVQIKLWYVAAVGVVGFVGIIFLARTGHETSIQPSNLELIFRNFLEYELIARPRTKEFLIAFPALMLLIYAVNRHFRFSIIPLGLLASIGFASVVNTFSHIRTPLYLSLFRTLYSTVFGIAIGIVLVLVLDAVLNYVNARRGSVK
jgi:hypothetical protein